jgi:hypothetical protein
MAAATPITAVNDDAGILVGEVVYAVKAGYREGGGLRYA